MKRTIWFLFLSICKANYSPRWVNQTLDPASQQLLNFRLNNPKPVGVITTSGGAPVDILSTLNLNKNLASNEYFFDTILQFDAERIPERVVHAKGSGALGYFEVTNDVSKYIRSDVFNGIGKRTPIVARLSSSLQNLGGSDLARELKGLAVKFYTKEGNLDLLGLSFPAYFYNDPIDFPVVNHAFRRNPRSNLIDLNAIWDIVARRPIILETLLWQLSDYGIPNGYRTMDAFPIHTYEITNKHGYRNYVKFNLRTEQGLANLTTAQAAVIAGTDPDYFTRDLYNAIESGNFPAWRLEIDIMTPEDIKSVDYDPFDPSVRWKLGTFRTETIGRVVLDRNVDNHFAAVESSAYFPGHIVPGIEGPLDNLYQARLLSYRDTQNHRIGINHNKILVNLPITKVKTYIRDGAPPVRENMRDVPNYYPNSFNGPLPYVDERRPKDRIVIYHKNSIDLALNTDFYNNILRFEGPKQRLVDNIILFFTNVYPETIKKILRLFSLIDADLYRRVVIGLRAAAK